ncbi:MAG: 3-methylitaconate isomerase [Deltaproteobacteria bacterium]|nr:3-methylitaconate isomerase [Deltaproteobacteria bacterium]
MQGLKSIPCSILRGGTSKGVFFLSEDLPPSGKERDRIIKAVMGTPDKRQINGLGGADILTSKIAIIGPPSRSDADLDYTFGQVGIAEDTVSYDGNCGNISAAVGPFAIEKGMVKAKAPFTTVKIHNTNTAKIIIARVPVEDGLPKTYGDFKVEGVPGSGAEISLDFSQTVGSLNGKLLPTGQLIETLSIPELGTIPVSFVDIANPVAFVRANDLGLNGWETTDELERNLELLERLERLRGHCALRLGLVAKAEEAFSLSPYVPFLTLLAPAQRHNLHEGTLLDEDAMDLIVRLVGFKRAHKAFPGTGACCVAVAAHLKGSLVHAMLRDPGSVLSRPSVRIAHPNGVLSVKILKDAETGNLEQVSIGRTWKKVMEGVAFF